MKSNNKVTRGKTIDNLFCKSWDLLPYAIRVDTYELTMVDRSRQF